MIEPWLLRLLPGNGFMRDADAAVPCSCSISANVTSVNDAGFITDDSPVADAIPVPYTNRPIHFSTYWLMKFIQKFTQNGNKKPSCLCDSFSTWLFVVIVVGSTGIRPYY